MKFPGRSAHVAFAEIASTVRCNTNPLAESMPNEKSVRNPNNIPASHRSAGCAQNDESHHSTENPARTRPAPEAAKPVNHSNHSPRSGEYADPGAALTPPPPI